MSNAIDDNGEFDIKRGNRKITLASMNVTTLKKHEMIDKVTKHMKGHKIDIACIQETHFNTNEMIQSNDYNIYFCHDQNPVKENENQQNIKGGVAIAIRKTYNKNIYQINRIDKRIIEIRLKQENLSRISLS